VSFSDRVFVGFFLRVDSLQSLVQFLDGALFQPQQRAGAKGTYCVMPPMHKCTNVLPLRAMKNKVDR